MTKLYQRLLFSIVSFTFFALSFVVAEEPDSFLVTIDPDTFGVWESVDMTITATKDWAILKDFIWDVFIDISGLTPDNYTVPHGGFYSFLIQDQWSKLFSKWLVVQKAGTYQVIVEDVFDSTIIGKTTIIVGNASDSAQLKQVNITTPINGSTEKKDSINIIWSSFDLRNSPIDIYLNGVLAGSTQTDSVWNFSFYLSNLKAGQNQIQAKVLDINNILIWESSLVLVNYEELVDDVFNSIKILPSGSIKQWDKVVFDVSVAEEVTSVEMRFSDGSSYPLDRSSPGVFSKEISMISPGAKDVSLSLMVNGEFKNYTNIASFLVTEDNSVSNIKFVTTWVDGTSVMVSWDSLWNSSRYRISYGINHDDLQKTVDVSSTGVLIENLQVSTKYFFQITPLDWESHASGEPSDVVEYNPSSVGSACVVKGIVVKSEKVGDKYFLIWDSIENVTKYEVYRSDWSDMSDMKKVWETTGTMFEYFFDKYAETDQYAYYQVQAICSDGSNVVVDQAQKVQVWPFENTILIVMITLFIYAIFKLYRSVEV